MPQRRESEFEDGERRVRGEVEGDLCRPCGLCALCAGRSIAVGLQQTGDHQVRLGDAEQRVELKALAFAESCACVW